MKKQPYSAGIKSQISDERLEEFIGKLDACLDMLEAEPDFFKTMDDTNRGEPKRERR